MPCPPRPRCARLSGLFLFLFIQTVLCRRQKKVASNLEGKIIGGIPVPIERYPHTVQLYNNGALCAGTILSSWTIMTASHCFDYNENPDEIEIHAGSRYSFDMTSDKYDVWYIVRHEDYNKAMPFACDIALVHLTTSIKFSDKVIKGVLVNTDKWMVPGEANFTAMGWGWTTYNGEISQNGLMMTTLHFVPLDKCSELHNLTLSPDMFCLYGNAKQDTCKGDSGGSVLWHGMAVGIVSHGDGCAQKNKPSVYTNVWYFRKWIKEKMYAFWNNFCVKSLIDGVNTTAVDDTITDEDLSN